MSTSSIFAGNSRFAADFTQVIERAVRIATLPKTLLEQQKAAVDNHTAGLVSLKAKVGQLQSSVRALAGAFGSASWSATSSNEAAVSVTAGSSPTAGAWNVKVTDVGATTAFTVTGFPPVAEPGKDVYSSGATRTLLVDLDPTDGNNDPELITLNPPGPTLQNVVDEINKKAGSRVRAAMVNVGTSAAPRYQLSLQSVALGPVDITFSDGVQTSTNPVGLRGWTAKYNVNGTDVSSDARTVTLAPGVTAELKAISASAVSVQTSQTSHALSSALENLASAYNAVLTELGKHRGDKTAALAGDSILNTVQSALRNLLTVAGPSGSFSSLTDVGIGFDKTNRLHLDADIFNSASRNKFADLQSFFGDGENAGLVRTLSGALDSLTRDSSGILSLAIDTDEKTSAAQAKHISAAQERIDRLELQLNTQMAAADATIAMLEQKVTYFEGMWKAMSGKRES